MYFRSWDSVHSFTPATANGKQSAADSNITISQEPCFVLLLLFIQIRAELNRGRSTMHCTFVSYIHSYIHDLHIFSLSLHVSAHMWSLHLTFTSCGPVLLFVWALPHLSPVTALGSSLLEGFMPPADPEDLSRLLGHPRSPAVVLLLNTACVIHHMLSWAVRGSHDKCCVSVYETIMLASLFKPPLSSTVDCSALAKSVLWARGAIIQRQGDVSSVESKKYTIFHYTPVLWKCLGKQQERHECN